MGVGGEEWRVNDIATPDRNVSGLLAQCVVAATGACQFSFADQLVHQLGQVRHIVTFGLELLLEQAVADE